MNEFDRRTFLKIAFGSLIAACSPYPAPTETPSWPKSQEAILAKIKELKFPVGSEIRSTFFFRKIMYENAQVMKVNGNWQGGDESDWMNHLDVIDREVKRLADAGVAGGRLAVVPSELTKDGESYNWQPLETALGIFAKYHMAADLCVGPLDFPYGPGIRLPQKLEDAVRGANHLIIGNTYSPKTSSKLTDVVYHYSINFLNAILGKYGKDARVDKVYIGNEWPDPHGVENTDTVMVIDKGLMQEYVKTALSLTDKKIVLNTNIHVSKLNDIKNTFGDLFQILGNQGVLGIDAYPTQELADPNLAKEIPRYGGHVQRLREIFPEIILSELQAEPWPPVGVAGKSWQEIEKDYKDQVVTPYYEKVLPQTLESYVIASGIKEVGFWGAPAWSAMAQMNYNFPVRLVSAINASMRSRF